MKCVMKSVAVAFLVMGVIIAAQMGLTYAYSYRVGEVFGNTAATVVFWYAFCRCLRLRQQKREAKKSV